MRAFLIMARFAMAGLITIAAANQALADCYDDYEVCRARVQNFFNACAIRCGYDGQCGYGCQLRLQVNRQACVQVGERCLASGERQAYPDYAPNVTGYGVPGGYGPPSRAYAPAPRGYPPSPGYAPAPNPYVPTPGAYAPGYGRVPGGYAPSPGSYAPTPGYVPGPAPGPVAPQAGGCPSPFAQNMYKAEPKLSRSPKSGIGC